MASTSLSLSTPFVTGQNFTVSPPPVPPRFVRFRPSATVSAAYATAERTISHIASPASLYEVLGIQTGATCKDVKSAYRRLARVLHPDVASNGQNDSSADEFIRIHAAYATLSDPEKRADYDRKLFLRRRPTSSPFSMSAGSTTATASTASRFPGYTRRTWETDQCW